jgi:hypothetical protein
VGITEGRDVNERIGISTGNRAAEERVNKVSGGIDKPQKGMSPAEGVLLDAGDPEHDIEDRNDVVEEKVRDFLRAFGVPEVT